MAQRYTHDVLIMGSGAAGLAAALELAPHLRVAVLSKGPLNAGSTWWAQGGIAAVVDPEDAPDDHIADTLRAGAGLCDPEAVRWTVDQSPAAVRWLAEMGVQFDRSDQHPDVWHLTTEGGHSRRRVLHVADATGQAIEGVLINQVQARDNVELFEQRVGIDLITRRKLGLGPNACLGAYVLNRESGRVEVFQARHTILATGGASKAYLYTSNPDGATGDGIAMAWRAGCRVANLEFNQFHPTCLYHPHAKSFLISEAVRGEGGRLLLPDGSRFMPHFDEREELAPRDIVARAIDHEIKRLGIDCVYLDISHRSADFIETHFPNILARCREFGIDMIREPIPVVPAAHYTCGGVLTDRHGRSDLPRLHVVGEASCTGLHGANRMASNSLLECIVYGRSAAAHIMDVHRGDERLPAAPAWDESMVTDSDEDVVISHNWDELRRFMWDYVGIVRTDKRLARARHRVKLLREEIQEYYANHRVTNDLIELRNLVQVAGLIIRSAMLRRESRGLHYTLDCPDTLPRAHDTVLVPMDPPDTDPPGPAMSI